MLDIFDTEPVGEKAHWIEPQKRHLFLSNPVAQKEVKQWKIYLARCLIISWFLDLPSARTLEIWQ